MNKYTPPCHCEQSAAIPSNKRATKFATLLLTISLLLPLTACKKEDANTNQKPTIKIGVLLPLTGDSMIVGQPVRDALALSLKDSTEGKNLKYNYELFFEDTKNESKTAYLNFNRLNSINSINAVISLWSPTAMVIKPIVEKDEIVHMTCSWGYSSAKGFYSFNHSSFPKEQSQALISELKKRNVKTVGLAWDMDPGNVELTSVLVEELQKNDIELLFNNKFNRGQVDFRTEIHKMKQKNPDMVLMFIMVPGLNSFIKQKKELGFDAPMTTIEYFSYAPELFEGMWYISDAKGSDEFTSYIEEKGLKIENCVANMYDSLGLLINAYETAGVQKEDVFPHNKEVVEVLLKSDDYKSVLGQISIDEEGNIGTTPQLRIIKNGKPVALEE